MRFKRILIPGTLFAIIGLVISLLANPPGVWKSSLQGWGNALFSVGIYLVVLVLGCALGYSISVLVATSKPRVELLNDEEYRKEFRKLLKERKFHLIKIFGYTGEVVTNDLIEYGDRYHSHLEVRLLQRNWVVEELDEREHNQHPEVRGLRKWNKSEAIRKMAFDEWDHAMKRVIRYYSHQPILKGAILCSPDDGQAVAFIGLLRWDPSPREGGSVFKSVPGYMLMIQSGDGQSAKDIIARIESQFNYEWCYGLTAEEVAAQQQPPNLTIGDHEDHNETLKIDGNDTSQGLR